MKQLLSLALALGLCVSVAVAQPDEQLMYMDIEVEELLFLEQSHIYNICEPFLGDLVCQVLDAGIKGSVELKLGRSVDLVGNVDWDAVDVENFKGHWVGWVETKLRYGTNHPGYKQITVESDVNPNWDVKIEVENLQELIPGITSVALGTPQGAKKLSTTPTAIIRNIKQAFGEAEVEARVEADPTEVYGTQSLTLTYTITNQ